MSADPNAALEVYLLGRFRVARAGQAVPDDAWRRRKARQLFKCLLTRRGHRLTRDEAIELLWPESDPDAAGTNLRSTVHALRRALDAPSRSGPASLIVVDRETVSLRPDVVVWVDADAFEQAVARARQAADPLPFVEQANALYLGDYLPDDLYEDWAAERRDNLRRSWVELQHLDARHAERHGDPARAAAALERLLGADPCDEPAAQELMRLYARQGRRADALRIYQRLEQALRDELAVDPSDATAILYRRITSGELQARDGEGERGRGGEPSVSPSPSLPLSPSPFTPAYPFPVPPRMIGRQVELAQLERALELGRAGGQTLLLGAPAGTGKSALVGTLVRRAEQAGVLCLVGGCYEQEGVIPLGPFQEALADYFLAQPPERVRTELGGAATDLARVVPELRYHLDLPDSPLDGGADRGRLFGAVHACLRGLAEREPVLLCLEDLHAADAATLQLVHYLARQTRRLPLTMIGTFRTEQAPAGQPLAQLMAALLRERLAGQVTLGALDRDDTARLVAALLDGPASEGLSNSLYAATEGNPLFVEQLVLALREEGRVDRRAGVWQETADPGRGVPRIIREVIGRRFDRLSPRCRETLAVAAVFGQSVPHAVLLAALHPQAEADLLADLDEALGAHLLYETPSGYAFGHALLREAVYWGLSTPRRMLLHAWAGETLERLTGPRAADHAAELAHHFALAGESAAVRARAVHYSLEAGRRAAALSAHREALAHFTRACELLEQDADRADPIAQLDALEGRAHAERELGMWSASIATLRESLRLTSDPIRRARVHGEVGHALHHTHGTAAALAEADAGLAELDRAPPGPDTATARLRLQYETAYLLFLRGRYREALDIGRRMLPAAAGLSQPRPLIWAHSVVGLGCSGLGCGDEALEQREQALGVAERANDRAMMAVCAENIGIEHCRGGRWSEAQTYLERSVALYRDAASELRGVNALQTLGRVALYSGDLAQAEEQAELALSLALAAGDRWAADCHELLGTVHLLRAAWDDAEARFALALPIREQVGHAAGTVESLVGLGLASQRRGDWGTAAERYARAVEVAGLMDPSVPVVKAHRHLGLLRLRLGDTAAAEHFDAMQAFTRAVPRSLEHAPALLALAEFEQVRGNLAGAVCAAEGALGASYAADVTCEVRAMLAVLLPPERLKESREHAAETLRLSERLAAPLLLGLAQGALGRVELLAGNATSALHAFERAVQVCGHAQAPYERAQALIGSAEALRASGARGDAASAFLREALVTFEQLGARPAATRVRDLLEWHESSA